MEEKSGLEKLRDLCLFLSEEKAVAVLNHVNAKHRVASRDEELLFVGAKDGKDLERFNLIVRDGIVVEIYFE